MIRSPDEEAAVLFLCKQAGTKVSCDQLAMDTGAPIGSDVYETVYQVAGHFMLDASNGATKVVACASNAAMNTLAISQQDDAVVAIAKVCSGSYLTVEEYLTLMDTQEP